MSGPILSLRGVTKSYAQGNALDAPTHPYTQLLIAAVPKGIAGRRKPISDPSPGSARDSAG